MQYLPDMGEAVETLSWWFEVVDLNGRRTDKVLATKTQDSPMRCHGDAAAVGQASP